MGYNNFMKQLAKYRAKRKFDITPEPKGGSHKASDDSLIFVVQQHAARAMHYDVRLEFDGVLKSWAVPKGPSTNPKDKRLAIPTEDHPLEYASFEGIIPEGQYGAGKVIVWDTGTFTNKKPDSFPEAWKKGRIEVELHGQKLQGGYALVRGHGPSKGAKEWWLLVKMDDDFADHKKNITKSEPASVISGKTLEEL